METAFQHAVAALDAVLIAPLRLAADPALGFVCGMAFWAAASALIGRAGLAGLARLQRERREREEGRAKKHHDLSLRALKAGDKPVYLAANRLANEAYGNAMALAAGRAAALLWPGCAVLAWAYWRFAGVPLPLVGESVGPAAFFLPFFLAAHWGLNRVFPKPPPAPRPPSDLPPSPFE